jgi:dihydrofolate reductase
MLNLIFCVDNSGLFGRKNNLPWYFKEDLKYFMDITTNFNKIDDNNVIVMGYNTWTSLKKKLPNRCNVVISNRYTKNNETENNPDYVYQNFDKFMLECKKDKLFYNKNIFIIGGKKLLSYVIVKYNKFIKHVFMNIIDHSFPQFLDDVVFKIYSFNDFNISKLSGTTIYCLNNNDNKYYYIKFNQFINKNFKMEEVINFTDKNSINNNNINNNKNNISSYGTIDHNSHNQYTILEDVQDVPLEYCNECDSIVKQPVSFTKKYFAICNDFVKNKCKCFFC